MGEFEEEAEPSVDLESLVSNAVCVTLFCLDPTLDSQVHHPFQPPLHLCVSVCLCVCLCVCV